MTGTGDDIEPLGQLSPQDWMTAPETQRLIAALSADGAEVRFVGGCVRDALAHRPVKDIDIATPLKPEAVIERLEAVGIKAVPTGIDHGTVTAVVDGKPFEVTTLRKDVACDGRHAEVEYTDDWKADAARRDLTINAMSATPNGRVYDYFDGISHLAKGRIRFIGMAKNRIAEDTLRILRYFRFFAHYAIAGPNKEAMAAIRVAAPELKTLSAERVREELLKILEADSAADVLLRMQGIGVLEQVLPEAKEFGRLRVLCWLGTRGVVIAGVGPQRIRRLAAVLDGFGSETARETALAVATRLKFSNADRDRLIKAMGANGVPTPDMDEPQLRRLLYDLGTESYRDAALIAWADLKATVGRTLPEETAAWIAVVELPNRWVAPDFPVKGRDLEPLGIAPGPEMGRLLKQLEADWLDGGLEMDRDALLARVEDLKTERGDAG